MTVSLSYANATGLGNRLRDLRQRGGFSMRQLAERAGVAASYISAVESEKLSPTIATLSKLLTALETDLATFFSTDAPAPQGYVFHQQEMRTATDANRCYTFLLPKRDDIALEMLYEVHQPGEAPEFETLPADLAGYVIYGELLLEIEGEDSQVLCAGDAFYLPAGRAVRGCCATEHPVQLLTVFTQPRY